MPSIDLPDFAADLEAGLLARGASAIAVPVIQPADPFLDTAGEDLRRRIFMTESEAGESLCLRPEFTIPVCLSHIRSAAGTPRRYSYLGQVFRKRREGPAEFYQAGIEDLGDAARAEADARAIDDAMFLIERVLPGAPLSVVVGDQAIFEAVLAALGLPAGWQKRLIHAFGNRQRLERLLSHLAEPLPDAGFDGGVAALLVAGPEADLVAHIEETMVATGYSVKAGRSPAEIARRLKEKAELARTRLDARALAVLSDFLALDVPLAAAPAALSRFADSAGLNLADALSPFAARLDALRLARHDLDAIVYSAAFGRPLDYYTGLVFEVRAGDAAGAVLAGGGRYDRLLTLLGAGDPIPAVGFALWLDRIEAARARGEAR